jgi:hypothetical protein
MYDVIPEGEIFEDQIDEVGLVNWGRARDITRLDNSLKCLYLCTVISNIIALAMSMLSC